MLYFKYSGALFLHIYIEEFATFGKNIILTIFEDKSALNYYRAINNMGHKEDWFLLAIVIGKYITYVASECIWPLYIHTFFY